MNSTNKLYIGIFALILLFTIALVSVFSFMKTDPLVASRITKPGRIVLAPLISATSIRSNATAETTPTAEATPEVATAPTPTNNAPPQPTPQPKVLAALNTIKKTTVQAVTPAAPKATCGGSFSEHFLCLLNEYRASKGKGKLSANSGLAKVALTHSAWMQTTGTFSHTGENGSRLTERCALGGITCRAENLAYNAKSPQNLLDMWKASGGHNVNMLGNYSTAGLGISGGYITLLFN